MSESLLCYYASYLATQRLAPQTIKTSLAAIRYMQVILGLPEPREFSFLPRLRLVQSGIQRTHLQRTSSPPRVRLRVTPSILNRIKELWSARSTEPDIIMLWAAACLCFFGFFRSGELTVPSAQGFDPTIHLSWGDVAVDNPTNPTAIRVLLKRSGIEDSVIRTLGRWNSTAFLSYIRTPRENLAHFSSTAT